MCVLLEEERRVIVAGAQAEGGEQGQTAHNLRGFIRRLSLFLHEGRVGGY